MCTTRLPRAAHQGSCIGQGRARQSKGITIRYKHTLLGTLGQDRAGQGRAGQGYMEQAGWVMGGKAGHRKGQGQGQGQSKAGPIQAGQGRAEQGGATCGFW